LEANASLTEDLHTKLSEKEANGGGAAATANIEDSAALRSRVESLAAAYNDIQDRLYEIDKSWKNNVVIYGIQSEGNDEDPIVTEEKVNST